MNMHELAVSLYKIILRNISEVINPLIKPNSNWTDIESKINEWFNTYDILCWSISYIEKLSNSGTIFYDQHGTPINAELAGDMLQRNDFVKKAKEDVLNHFNRRVPIKKAIECGSNSTPFLKVTRNGNILGVGCSAEPDISDPSILDQERDDQF